MDSKHAFLSPELPADKAERARLLASFARLMTPSDPICDALTAVGAFCFHAPVCVITLTGEGLHFFKSAYGSNIHEMAREGSFTDVALQQDEPLVILDAMQDPRFCTGPQIHGEQYAGFYAGAPLVSADGYRLGTFCIVDTVPRLHFGEQEIETLVRLAVLAGKAIEQRLIVEQVAQAQRETQAAVEHTRQILESTTDEVFLLDKDWRFTYINTRANKHMARGRDLLGMNFWDAFPEANGTQLESNYREVVQEQTPIIFGHYSPGLEAFLEIHAHPCGEGLAVYFRDVTPQRVQEIARQKAEERYRLATHIDTEGIWDWCMDTGEVFFSSRWQEILGLPPVDFTGSISHWLDRFHPQDLQRMNRDALDLRRRESNEFQFEYRIRHEDRSFRWIQSHGSTVRDQKGHISRMLGAICDITDKKTRDPLTGLHNRSSMLEAIETRLQEDAEALKNGSGNGKTFALLVINVDEFKRLNDSFGHLCGDEVLKELARRLQDTIDQHEESMAARISGAEFVVLVGKIQDVDNAMTYANFLQGVLGNQIVTTEPSITVSTSFGIAMGDKGYSAPDAMLEDATVALNQVKVDGRSQFAVFGVHMRERARRRIELEFDLRTAVEKDQFCLHYQPKVILSSGELIGFEALVRWIHPQRGMIPPAEFIPYAEESGLIIEIGAWTLREALRQLMEWRDADLVSNRVSMAVNLSTKQFEKKTILADIQRYLVEASFPPESLTLEVTESALIGNISHARDTLMALSDLGIRMDMDDFGTGYSSLSYLHTLPFHALKIDQSFTRNLEESHESRTIVRSIIQLGQSLNLDVIAEGIETEAQRDRLASFGCLFGQGYFYSRPQTKKSIAAMLQNASALPTESVRLPLTP